MVIGQWYVTRRKTLAHVDVEIVKEMKKYQQVVDDMKSIVDEQNYSPYLRQFPYSTYCATEWKKKSIRAGRNIKMIRIALASILRCSNLM